MHNDIKQHRWQRDTITTEQPVTKIEQITTKDLRVGDVIQDVESEDIASVFEVDDITEDTLYLKPVKNCIGYKTLSGFILFPNIKITWYRHG